jgi:ABC-type Fe3+/spermidine/putrescine transport system ATPase subunit
VALARALVIQPRLLLLDEPLSNLDRELRADLRQMIRTLQQEAGITMLFVTHDQAEAVTLADRIGLMINGRLRQIGVPRDFYENPADAQVAYFFGATNFIAGIKQGQVVKTEMGDVEVLDTAVADGPVTLTIRPEAIEIGANGHNNFPAQVQASYFSGQTCQCDVHIKGTHLQIMTHPFSAYQPGEEIILHFPRERICLLPN